MNLRVHLFHKILAVCLSIFLTVSLAEAPAMAQQSSPVAQSTENGNSSSASTNNGGQADSNRPVPQNPETTTSQTGDQNNASVSLPPAPQQQDDNSQPVGTAAAPDVKTTGVAASRPAGAVIAPAKQKRSRSLLIRVGLIVGAAVAVGTVVGLSEASPSHPH